jgi:hypothetical protein
MKSIYTENPQPHTKILTTYPIVSLNTLQRLNNTLSSECIHQY